MSGRAKRQFRFVILNDQCRAVILGDQFRFVILNDQCRAVILSDQFRFSTISGAVILSEQCRAVILSERGPRRTLQPGDGERRICGCF